MSKLLAEFRSLIWATTQISWFSWCVEHVGKCFYVALKQRNNMPKHFKLLTSRQPATTVGGPLVVNLRGRSRQGQHTLMYSLVVSKPNNGDLLIHWRKESLTDTLPDILGKAFVPTGIIVQGVNMNVYIYVSICSKLGYGEQVQIFFLVNSRFGNIKVSKLYN